METVQAIGAAAACLIALLFGAVIAGRFCAFNGDVSSEGGEGNA